MSEGELLKPKNPSPGGVRALAEGAMLTALALVLAVISIYVPILYTVASLVFPVPLALLVLRHGLKYGCIGAVSIFLLSAMLIGLPNAIYLFILYGFLGLFFGWCFLRHKNAAFTLLVGVLISSAAILFSLLFPTLLAGISLDQYMQMLESFSLEFANILQQQGANEEMLLNAESVSGFIVRLLPSLLVCGAMCSTLLCYVLMCKLLRRFGYDIPMLPPFNEWRMDWRLLWPLIVALALAGLGSRFDLNLMARIGDNMLMAFMPILLVCGISVLVWLLKPWRAAGFIKVLVVLFAFQLLGALAFYMIMLISVFDPIFDIRRRVELLRQKQKS
ncbi:MAG: YybS family protein [Clostridiales bacterium]|nr:YybS family protein [Clostridiales bacterium]